MTTEARPRHVANLPRTLLQQQQQQQQQLGWRAVGACNNNMQQQQQQQPQQQRLALALWLGAPGGHYWSLAAGTWHLVNGSRCTYTHTHTSTYSRATRGQQQQWQQQQLQQRTHQLFLTICSSQFICICLLFFTLTSTN
ncbi:hypothetical protein AWZ03_013618 [Drosophila navojoa]|uniref:Uncharacterized protein n=1 Tax=Drosophila navojoa TaxID=7232 RepID=A0A484AVR6_DRONA|nr:hypothetical protein AWZ03_013618 [Drosophila navojoa]